MQRKSFMRGLCGLFTVLLVVHLLRILQGWSVEVNGVVIPFLVSYGATVILVVLIYKTYQLSR